ncbi:female-specific histamine-binding protein 2-like [Ixodes scapularis]|uniref:female-specific histamine-binding protein 2-like n=1 Tax=Ixodes scapularis TaxID=6945 RepID=UPI001A9E175C|nr:female-specific histamine-binding protein 2-like [Ixodes scapularis]
MYPTLLVFASLVAAIASVGSQDTSSTGSPVDAWRTVTLQNKFYLIYRSYKNDEGLGGTGECVTIQLSEKDDATKTTKSRMTYKNPETSELTEKNVRIKVTSSGGDTIEMSNTEGGDTSTTRVQFVYSDYGTCDVAVVLGTDEKSK